MKKTILITLGIALIGIVAGVWVYLIMFGPPSTVNDVLTKFSFGGNSSPTIVATGTSTVDTSSLTNTGVLQPLRQLTTRPVAGAAFIDGGIRYVEKGTGYIYDIDLSSGQESLAGGTTIPQAVGAVFSPSGNRLAITAEKKDSHEITVGTITRNDAGEGVLDGIRLPENTHDVAFDNSGEKLWYLKETNAGTEGHEFDIPKQSDRTLFSIPLKDVRALWGKDTYIYTTPSVAQTGYIYKVDNGSLQYLREGGLGLMGIEYRGGLIPLVASSTALRMKTAMQLYYLYSSSLKSVRMSLWRQVRSFVRMHFRSQKAITPMIGTKGSFPCLISFGALILKKVRQRY